MNCDDYKQTIDAQPNGDFDGRTEHAAECPDCAQYSAEMQLFDRRIAAALAIDVPDLALPELPAIETDNIQTDTTHNVVNIDTRRDKTGWHLPVWAGLAASVVFAVALGVRFAGGPGDGYGDGLSLADEVIAHLDHEPSALQVSTEAVSDTRLLSVVRPGVATMDRDMGLITYAQSCDINGKSVPHLVLQGKNGPVTILLMPEHRIDEAVTVSTDVLDGVILPVGGGSIAIVGEKGEALQQIQKRVIDSVEWSI